MFELWLSWRYMVSRRMGFFNLTTILSILGMSVGVGALTVVMAVVNGFETNVRKAVIDMTGHIWLFKTNQNLDPLENLMPRLREALPDIESVAPFLHLRGVIPHEGRMSGIAMDGFEMEGLEKTLNLKSRVVKGSFDFGSAKDPKAVVGRTLAEKLELEVGEKFKVVFPESDPSAKVIGFKPRIKSFTVSGIIDLGKHEYDSRFVFTSAENARSLAGVGKVYSGLRIRLKDFERAPIAAYDLANKLGVQYDVRDWRSLNYNFFEALALEKIVIFLMMFLITVAACFNISGTLFISVLRRFKDVSILRTLGGSQRLILKFFTLQGLAIGLIGSGLGLVWGVGLCIFVAKTNFIYVPSEIYHLRRLPIEIRSMDVAITLASSILLCFIATLVPALRGSKLNLVEGLKYDQ